MDPEGLVLSLLLLETLSIFTIYSKNADSNKSRVEALRSISEEVVFTKVEKRIKQDTKSNVPSAACYRLNRGDNACLYT